MLSGICIGTNDMTRAAAFYDAVLATIGMSCVLQGPAERGYAGTDGRISLFVLTPFNGEPASFGNGTQAMFYAPNARAVRAFRTSALTNGGTCDGPPGPRSYHPEYYGAYVRDPDGNKLNVSVSLQAA